MRTIRHARHGPLQWGPAAELLEIRTVLSPAGAWLGPFARDAQAALSSEFIATAVTPADGATLHQSPETISIQFNTAIDPWSLFYDVEIDSIGADGSRTPAVDPGLLTEEVSPDDPCQLLVTLPGPLGAGSYRIGFLDSSGLASTDGQPLTNGPEFHSDFTIAPAGGVVLPDATNLGVITSSVMSVPGILDFSADPHAVGLYEFVLPPSHDCWRLGLESLSTRLGGDRGTALALFDAQGQLIATTTLGRPDFPADPYLFEGLAPGTYFVGISDPVNVPGDPGGYDPSTGAPGTESPSSSPVAYQLDLVADPADTPTVVTGFRLDHGDPTSSVPTGFTMQFSGPLGLTGDRAGTGEQISQGIEVVDASGRVWPAVGTTYDESSATISYVFGRELPAGFYTVRIAGQNGLTDLAGHAPTQPGLATGVLANFVIMPLGPLQSTDLGPLYSEDAAAGKELDRTIGPGQAVSSHFAVLTATNVRLTIFPEGALQASLFNEATGTFTPLGDLGPSGGFRNVLVSVQVGGYDLVFRATGTQPASVRVLMLWDGALPESLLLNGVGQGPALNLRAVAPSDGLPEAPPVVAAPEITSTTNSAASAGPFLPIVTSVLVSIPTPSSHDLPGESHAPGGLTLTVSTGLVGLPTAGSDFAATVSSSAASATPAPAALSHSALPGGQAIGFGEALSSSSSLEESFREDVGPISGTDGALKQAGNLAQKKSALAAAHPHRGTAQSERPEPAPAPSEEQSLTHEEILALARQLAAEKEASADPRAGSSAGPKAAGSESAPSVVQGPSQQSKPGAGAAHRLDPVTLAGVVVVASLPFRDRFFPWRKRSNSHPSRRTTWARSRPG